MTKLHAFVTLLLVGAAGATSAAADADLKMIKDLRVLVAIYRGAPDADAKDRIDDAELASIKNAIECGRLYYFRNSFGELALTISYEIIDEPAPETARPEGGPTYEHIETDLRRRGYVNNQFDGLFTTGIGLKGNWGGFRVFDKTGACFGGGGTGGQLRQFPSADPDTGYDWAWTFVHEFQHALDLAIAGGAGFNEFIHGHPFADSAAHPGRVIENSGAQHWDWEACTLRNFKSYLQIPGATGSYIFAVDSDGDGLVDRHPALPMDEERFGSDPHRADTDGDGLDDLAEFTADIYRGSDPRAIDTDGDGFRDLNDPWPTVAIQPTIVYAHPTPQLDGEIDDVYSVLIDRRYASDAPQLAPDAVQTFACWTEDALYFAAKAPEKCELLVQIDTSGDNGFWCGGDTYIWSCKPDENPQMQTPKRQPWPGGQAAWGTDGAGNAIVEVMLPVMVGQGWSREINFGGQRLPEDVADGLVLLDERFVSFNITVDLVESDKRVLLTPTWTMINTQLHKSPEAPDNPALRFTKAVQTSATPVARVVGVGPKTPVTIVNADGDELGRRVGNGEVRLDGVVVGQCAKSGANTIYAQLEDGRRSAPFELVVDAAAPAPQITPLDGGKVKVVGEPGAKVVVELQDAEAQWRSIATQVLGDDGQATVSVPQPLTGFYAEYFDALDFTEPVMQRVDPQIRFAFRGGSPQPGLIDAESFSIRWTGYINLAADERVTFFLSTDDGSRLYVDGRRLIDHWGHHEKSTKQADVALSKGVHEIRVDYYEELGWASADLEAQPAGGPRTFDIPVAPLKHMPTQFVIRATQTDALGNVSPPSATATLD